MSFFFFFQAEDGIRDYKVTGVQTCALPIWAGGDGVVREFEALAPMELSVLAERRRHAPGGAAGGGSGAPGRTVLNGAALAPKVSALLEPGDVVRIETPGGGGWGEPERGGEP